MSAHEDMGRVHRTKGRFGPHFRFHLLLPVCLLLILTESKAQAYADPGSGSLILQMLFAAVVGALFYVRRFAAWIKKKVSKN
jgi:hypothetical protein